MKITFILSSTAHVRFLKRVEIINNIDSVDIRTFAFERKGSFPGKQVNFDMQLLGAITHESYLKRFGHILKAVSKIKSGVKNTDVVYTFGLDMLFLGWISKLLSGNKNAKLVYEVGDIREILLGDSLLNKIFRNLEQFLIKRINLLVVTSKAFYTEYFIKVQNAKFLQYCVIENKLDNKWLSSIQKSEYQKNQNNTFIIGYFGVLRCERTFEILKQVAQKAEGKIQIYIRGIAGIPNKQQLETAQKTPGITYGGAYIVPDDIPEMYNSVDMVWACYPYQGSNAGNWCWARTIRFYESCFFKKPLFAQKGTEDCKAVEKYGIGVCLNLETVDETVDYILSLTQNDVENWNNNMDKLPEQIYMHTDEHHQLIKKLHSL